MTDRRGLIFPSNDIVSSGFVNEDSVLNVVKVAFGDGSSKYEKYRPNYAKEAIDVMMKEITTNLPPECSILKYNVLELGAGTGKTTEDLAPRLPKSIKYLATEPSLDFFKVLASKPLSVETKMATADSIPLEDNTVQNIVCGQCFHWFSNDKSLREMHRVLVPGGKLILMWKLERCDGDWYGEGSKQLLRLYEKAGVPTENVYHSGRWRDAIEASSLFFFSQHIAVRETEDNWSVDKFMEYQATISVYKSMAEEERRQSLNKLRQAILTWPCAIENPNELSMLFISNVYTYISLKVH